MKNINIDRIKQLVSSFEQKNEVIKEDIKKEADETVIKEEAERLKEIARIDEWTSNSQSTGYFAAKSPYLAGNGQTVNTFLPQGSENNSNNVVPDGNKLYNPNYTYLQPSEALKVAIKRGIQSGAPVNDMGFYEEVNWNLNNMGFPAKSALDIKNAISKMIVD